MAISERRYAAYLDARTREGLRRGMIGAKAIDARTLRVAGQTYVNLASNDYLALRFHPALIERGLQSRQELREATFTVFAPEFATLSEQAREQLADAIGSALSLDAWVVLRRRDRLSLERAVAVWRLTLTALLAHGLRAVAAE